MRDLSNSRRFLQIHRSQAAGSSESFTCLLESAQSNAQKFDIHLKLQLTQLANLKFWIMEMPDSKFP